MYIELYFLDNLIMNMLLLRLAAAFRSMHVKFLKMLLFSLTGAIYACFSVTIAPFLLLPIFKILLCILMSLTLPCHSIKVFAINAAATLASAFLSGGTAIGIAFLLGGHIEGGILYTTSPMRFILLIMLISALLPRLICSLLRRRSSTPGVLFTLRHKDISIVGTGIIDTGNSLVDPLSGLPVAVMFSPELKAFASIPIPISTASGSSVIYGFIPENLIVGSENIPLKCIIALSDEPLKQALFPPGLILNPEPKEAFFDGHLVKDSGKNINIP